jgi:hypothetical protein
MAPVISSVFCAFFVMTAHAQWDSDCEIKKAALARVVSTQAKINFIDGPSERTPACPSAESVCRLKAYLVPGDEVLVDEAETAYVCAIYKSTSGIETQGWLPRAALQMVPPKAASAQQWDGTWRNRDAEAAIVIRSHADEVEVSGTATWGSRDPERVKRGSVHTGGLNGRGTPRGQTLAIGYDPDRPEAVPGAQDDCAARLHLYGPYLLVNDNGRCGGLNVSFGGLYVRVRQ